MTGKAIFLVAFAAIVFPFCLCAQAQGGNSVELRVELRTETNNWFVTYQKVSIQLSNVSLTLEEINLAEIPHKELYDEDYVYCGFIVELDLFVFQHQMGCRGIKEELYCILFVGPDAARKLRAIAADLWFPYAAQFKTITLDSKGGLEIVQILLPSDKSLYTVVVDKEKLWTFVEQAHMATESAIYELNVGQESPKQELPKENQKLSKEVTAKLDALASITPEQYGMKKNDD